MTKNGWFDVDPKGLAKILARRGKHFALYELIQNAWDEPGVTEVNLQLSHLTSRRGRSELIVEDDAPNGFVDLAHAYTLFADSKKKGNPELRGRFNLGEKLFLSLCEQATITTTTGTVYFDSDGTRRRSRTRRKSGSVIEAILRMTKKECENAIEALQMLLVPENIKMTFQTSGFELSRKVFSTRTPILTFKATLPTETSNEEGALARTTRKTQVRLFKVCDGEKAHLYELGIPVVETGDKWHVDVGQKVPLTLDRENVLPSYLQQIRTEVFNRAHNLVNEEDVNKPWVQVATSDKRCTSEAATTFMDKKYGKKRVSYDPTDPEANKIAVSQGYTVVHGRQLNKDQWNKVKSSGLISSAGRVTPSHITKMREASGPAVKKIPLAEWRDGMKLAAAWSRIVAQNLLGRDIGVSFINTKQAKFSACWTTAHVCFNISYLGYKFFTADVVKFNDLLIHEMAHHYSPDHLSSEYHEACTTLGAKLADFVFHNPSIYQAFKSNDLEILRPWVSTS